MIKRLEIKNFRGFSEYKIDDVGQVNLLVGTNNCGKTSVLEAVQLLKSRGNPSVLISLLSHRGEWIPSEERIDRDDAEGDVCRLFHGFRLVPISSFIISAIDHALESLSVSVNELQAGQLFLFEELADSVGRYQLDVEWWLNQNRRGKEEYPISYTGGLSYDYMKKMFRYKSSIAARYKSSIAARYKSSIGSADDSSIELVPASSLTSQEIIALFDKIALTPDEDLVLEAVRIIEPDIIRLASLGGGERYYPFRSGDYARSGIVVKSSKWDERIPIGSFGDGIWRLLGLALSLVGAKNGTLLIDEIDTGLHHTVMSKMWKLICATAKKLNVQVFATTHSSDCWKTLADNAVEDEFADMPLRIHRINKDKKLATTFTNQEMHLALNEDIEVR